MKIAHFRAVYLDPASDRLDLGYVSRYIRGTTLAPGFLAEGMRHWDVKELLIVHIDRRNFPDAALLLGVLDNVRGANYLPAHNRTSYSDPIGAFHDFKT